MVASKTDLFDLELQQKACMSIVLAHPARIQMIPHVAGARTYLSGNISDMFLFRVPRSTINCRS